MQNVGDKEVYNDRNDVFYLLRDLVALLNFWTATNKSSCFLVDDASFEVRIRLE